MVLYSLPVQMPHGLKSGTQQTANQMGPQLDTMAQSFRRLTGAEANRIKPRRLRVVRAQPGDTVQRLANRMSFSDFQIDRFRVLNDLGPNDQLRAGRSYKIVTF